MKAEERHKLETNVLADWIGQTIKDIKPYSRLITTGVVLLAVIAGLAVVWPRFRDRASGSAWESLFSAMGAENFVELERIAEEHPGTPVAHWGLAVAADARLAGACMQLFGDKASASQELRRAIEDYTTVINESREPDLLQRALFGRARAYEAISGSRQGEGEIPKAITDYEQLVEKWPTGSYSSLAAEQVKRLKSQDTKLFYDKFAAYTPKRPVSKESELGGPKLPFDSTSLPDDTPSEFSKLLNLDDLKVKGAKSEQKAEPEKTEPGKASPAKAEPAKPEEEKAESPKPDTPKSVPAKAEPAKATPVAPAAPSPAPAKQDAPKK